MRSYASLWATVQRAGVVVGLLMLAGGLMANTPVSSSTVSLDAQVEYTPADANGQFTYMIDFTEPAIIDQHRSRSSAEFLRSSPANVAAREQLQALQAQRVNQMSQALGRSVSPSHYYLDLRNGVAMRLSPSEVSRIASIEGVKSIEREQLYRTQTFAGPVFIGADTIWDGTNTPDGSGLRGELMVAAILDSGIGDPSVHPSFADDPACGHGVGGVPSKVLSNLDCSSTDGTGLCNGTLNPFDENGHGSHTASTTAGNVVTNAATPSPDLPAPFDSISGVAYCAHIRSYDVCNLNNGGSCAGAELAAAFQSVLIHTDPAVIGAIPPVSVMNYSISGGRNPWNDFDRTKLDLVEAGVFVAASAGNTSGGEPDPVGLVSHRGPWVMSVAASTHDGQIFDGNISLAGGPQAVAALEGGGLPLASTYTGQLRWAGDVDAANNLGCVAFPAAAFDGEAALIERGACPFETKINNAVNAGANMVIVFTDDRAPVNMAVGGATSVSSFMIQRQPGLDMVTALAGATAEVTVDPTAVGVVNPAAGDILAGFSLRGPTPSPLQDLQKPNITAPGVNIYAADVVAGGAFGFGFKSGTSMSSPHVAGAAVLVRQAQPDWTVSEVKSAMQMTASRDGLKDDSATPWDWDDVGHGRVDLTQAALAGLVMDESIANYLAADPADGGDVKTLNTPDVRNVNCSPSCSFTRTVRNASDVATSWTVTPESFNPELQIVVSPSTFAFTGDLTETQTLTIDVTPLSNLSAAIEFGQILIDEDSSLAPQAHLTVAISGSPSSPPEAAVDATEFSLLAEEGDTVSATFNISNVAEGPVVEDLNFTIDEGDPVAVVLGTDREANPAQPIDLILDGGIASLTTFNAPNQEFLWFNQFTPTPLDVPFTLNTVDIGFAPGNGGVLVGDLFDVYVWVDPDRDPLNGATFLASVTGQSITSGVNFQTVTLPPGVEITADDGDVLIGVVNRTTAEAYGAPVSDAVNAATGLGRSWVALSFPGGIAANPPILTEAAGFGTLPDRNWTIRGFGQGGSACLTPSDVPWLSVTPNSGAVAAGDSIEVQIDVDTTGLAQGTYEARVCVNTDDVNNPVFVLPVSLEVTEVGGLPTIDVSAASVDGTVDLFNPLTSETFDISNLGSALDLEWSIEEAQAPAAQRGVPTLSVDGVEVFDALGSPANSSLTLNIGVGNSVTGYAYEVTVEAFDPSWLSESRMAILSNAGDPIGSGAEVQPDTTGAPGLAENASSGGFITLGTAVAANGAGEIYLEWFESFTDAAVSPNSAWSDAAAPTSLPAGIALQCTDQAACDAALAGPSVCESPSDVPWVSVSPTSGTTAPAGSTTVTVDFDGTGLDAGLYEAVLCINSNDPVTPRVELPVSLDVGIPATAAELTGTVQGLGYCQADPILAAGAGIEIVGGLETIMTTADANGVYSVFLDAANGPVDITASAPSHISFTETTVALTAGTTTTVDFGLVLEVACATATPASLSAAIAPDSTAAEVLTLSNVLGGAEYTWSIDFEEVASTPRGGVDPVQDGSFETGTPNAAWTEFSANFGTPLCDEASCGLGGGTGPRTGDWWTWFGGIASAESGSVSQDLTIPSGPSAELRFWLEIPASGQPGVMTVTVDGNEVFSVTEADAGTYPTYTEVVVDVSSFADGGTYTLEFASDTQAGAAATNFFVDDVQLLVQPGPVGCEDPQGVPWLSVDTAAGTLALGDTDDVVVTFDSTGVPTGNYQANLCVNTNDAETSLIVVPVEFRVFTDDLFQDRFEGVIRSTDPQDALRKIND